VAGEEFVGRLLLQVRPVVVGPTGHAIACGVLDLMLDDIASDVAALDVPALQQRPFSLRSSTMGPGWLTWGVRLRSVTVQTVNICSRGLARGGSRVTRGASKKIRPLRIVSSGGLRGRPSQAWRTSMAITGTERPDPNVPVDVKIIDCDAHWTEPTDLWSPSAGDLAKLDLITTPGR
jgi:hypothetical protein